MMELICNHFGSL